MIITTMALYRVWEGSPMRPVSRRCHVPADRRQHLGESSAARLVDKKGRPPEEADSWISVYRQSATALHDWARSRALTSKPASIGRWMTISAVAAGSGIGTGKSSLSVPPPLHEFNCYKQRTRQVGHTGAISNRDACCAVRWGSSRGSVGVAHGRQI
jgi:hypothetical protein